MRAGIFAAICALFLAGPAFAQTLPSGAEPGLDGLSVSTARRIPGREAPEAASAPASTPALADLVAAFAGTTPGDDESECLARAVYWESRGEPLSGQLAVAEVIINRARSGRFAPTLCGVVRQPYQFSFVRRGSIPQPPQGSPDWRTAVAIARIATDRLAEGGAPQALFFHARRINPRWRLTRVAMVGNHVFYR